MVRVRKDLVVLPDAAGLLNVEVDDLVEAIAPTPYLITAGAALARVGLTDQHHFGMAVLVPAEVAALTYRSLTIRFYKTDPDNIWGAKRGAGPRFARPERAILDSLNNPRYGVSITQCLDALIRAEARDPEFLWRLFSATRRYGTHGHGSRSAARRVGPGGARSATVRSGMSTHPLWNPYQPPTIVEIEAARIVGPEHRAKRIEVVEPDPEWPSRFETVRNRILSALGERAVAIEHVGSTSVPGLWAKPVIDVALTVADSSDEHDWLADLEAAGFELTVREPDWEEHRMLRGTQPDVHLHVFSLGAREPQRQVLFRDWLRAQPEDRVRYGQVKRDIAAEGHTDGMRYNNAKSGFVYDLYEKILVADPRHDHDPHPRH